MKITSLLLNAGNWRGTPNFKWHYWFLQKLNHHWTKNLQRVWCIKLKLKIQKVKLQWRQKIKLYRRLWEVKLRMRRALKRNTRNTHKGNGLIFVQHTGMTSLAACHHYWEVIFMVMTLFLLRTAGLNLQRSLKIWWGEAEIFGCD